jgi:hypothetical protein
MPLVTRQVNQGNLFKTATEPPGWSDGDLWSDITANTVKNNVGGTATDIGHASDETQTLTNKTFNGDNNTVTNMLNPSSEQTLFGGTSYVAEYTPSADTWVGQTVTIPSTYTFINITDIEFQTGSNNNGGDMIAAAFTANADPPTNTDLAMLAVGAAVVGSAVATTYKTKCSQMSIIQGGDIIFLAVNMDTLNGKQVRGENTTSENAYFSETYSANPSLSRRAVTWTAQGNKTAVKIYYIGYS